MLNIKPKYLQYLLRSIPNFLWPVKYLIIKKSLKIAGDNFRFGPDSVFSDHRLIEVGNNVFMGQRTTVNTTKVRIIIGNNVMFGPEVMVIGGDHNFLVPGKLMRSVKIGGINLPIEIEDDVWVGARCLILKGVKIFEGAVIGAGSIVTKSIPPYSIAVGIPAKPLISRFSKQDLEKHLQMVNSEYSIKDINVLYERNGVKYVES